MQALYSFGPKMKVQAIEQLKALETWVERQATGLDMATNPEALKQSFDKLLKVGPAWLTTRAQGTRLLSQLCCVAYHTCSCEALSCRECLPAGHGQLVPDQGQEG